MNTLQRQFLYDGRGQVAVIEQLHDGRWRAIIRGREIGVFDSRAQAIEAVDEETGAAR